MLTIYIDHTIVSREREWPALTAALATGKVGLVLSLWNLFEIGSGSDERQIDRRLQFLEGLRPLWMVERRHIQRQEVRRFLWHHVLAASRDDLVAVVPTLSGVEAFVAGRNTRIGLSARQVISDLDFDRLRQMKQLSPAALKTLQSTEPSVIKAKAREMFDAWIGLSIPVHDPERRTFTAAQRAELLTFCFENQNRFFGECPSLAVENALTDIRSRDPGRMPRESDGPDLQHVVAALPYAHLFFTRDGYQRQCAETARRRLVPMALAQVCATADELMSAIDRADATPG